MYCASPRGRLSILRAGFLIYLLGLALDAPLLAATTPATPPAISPGMKVVDQAGAEVGTVQAVQGPNLTIKTDRHEASIPVTSFAQGKGVLLFAMTRDQLNAEVEKSMAAFASSLVKGTQVYGEAGALAGTIDDTDNDYLTLKLTSGGLVRIPRSAVVPGPNGPRLGISSAELERLVAQAAPASGS